jgi:uncharacterized membrane protein YhaH (DUF805 family)
MPSRAPTLAQGGKLLKELEDLFTIDGRLDRRQYAWRGGLSIAWILYYAFYDFVTRGPGGPIMVVSLPLVVAWFIAAWVLFVSSVRRVQDIGWGPWPVAIAIGLMGGASKIQGLIGTRQALEISNVVGGVLTVIAVVAVSIKRGQAGPNRWGPDPRARHLPS